MSDNWKPCTTELPDCDLTVLIHHPDEDEPVWMGYHDGETWRTIDNTRCEVTHWQHLPEPAQTPNEEPSGSAGRKAAL
jgi:hypothetical protein